MLLYGLVGLLVLLAGVFVFVRFHSRRRRARQQALESAQRRAERQARRQARRQSREQAVVDAQKARLRGDRRPVVLVVDDSHTVVESIRKSLEDRQYRVVAAPHGREAWATLQDLRPDIVVSDIEMPYVDGLALLRLIRSDMQLANLPVILMSANAAAMVEAGKQEGVSGLLAKPFEDRDLVGQIRFLLQEG
jgi:chemosensory pili system protein ChpA (sensor histidine kinase/response regulator)